MTAFDLAIFAAKLVLGTLAFLLIGYFGRSDDKRVVGVMLAFPVLNGIGPLTSPDKDPVAMAQSMMPMIALNAVLFFSFITAFLWAKRIGHAGGRSLSYGIGVTGAAIWFLVAAWLMPMFDQIAPSPGWFTVIYLVAIAVVTLAAWSPRQSAAGGVASPPRDFASFWWQRRWRVAFFIISLVLLLAAARVSGADWVGRLSALPLVPLCVLAGLAIDEPEGLRPMRDPIFLGPGLSMILVLPFTLVLTELRQMSAPTYWALGITALTAGWLGYFLMVRFGIPPLATALDRWVRR
jgi:hypothetical protein